MRRYCFLTIWMVCLIGTCLPSVMADVDALFVGRWQTFDPERGNSPVEITITAEGAYHAVTRDLVHKTTDTVDGQFKTEPTPVQSNIQSSGQSRNTTVNGRARTESGHWTLTLSTGKTTSGLYEFQTALLIMQTEVIDKPRSKGILGGLTDRLRQRQKGRMVTSYWKHSLTGPASAVVQNNPDTGSSEPTTRSNPTRALPAEKSSQQMETAPDRSPSRRPNSSGNGIGNGNEIRTGNGQSAPAGTAGKLKPTQVQIHNIHDVTEGMEYFWMHEYELALPNLLFAAKAGNAAAAAMIGRIYLKGTGAPQNIEQGVYWVRYSAEHGDPDGQMAYAQMYERGVGVTKSPQEALAWYRKAAAQNYAPAEYNLAAALHGQNDNGEYQTYLRRAISHGLGRARQTQRFLDASAATMDAYHAGVKAFEANEFSQAAGYFRQAAKLGLPDAKTNLGWLYEFGKGVQKNEATAFEYYRQAAEEGEDVAQADVGMMYEDGKGVQKNESLAARWYEKAAAQNNAQGLFRLGRAYDFGIGVPQSREKAIAIYDRAGKLGDYQAAYFAHWLRDPTNLDFRTGADRDAYIAKMMADFGRAHAKVFARYSQAKTWEHDHPELDPAANPYR